MNSRLSIHGVCSSAQTRIVHDCESTVQKVPGRALGHRTWQSVRQACVLGRQVPAEPACLADRSPRQPASQAGRFPRQPVSQADRFLRSLLPRPTSPVGACSPGQQVLRQPALPGAGSKQGENDASIESIAKSQSYLCWLHESLPQGGKRMVEARQVPVGRFFEIFAWVESMSADGLLGSEGLWLACLLARGQSFNF